MSTMRALAVRCWAWLPLLLVLVACGEVPVVGKQGRATAFDDATDKYGKMLRWGYFEEALRYQRAKDGSAIPVDLARVARYRITGYKIVSKLLADTGREGRVVVTIEYYEIDSGVLHTLRDEQFWWFDDSNDHWYLGTPLPAFGLADG